jgi:hypothetical protein
MNCPICGVTYPPGQSMSNHISRTHGQTALLWSLVDRSGGPNACWPWLGQVNWAGYGLVAASLAFSLGTTRTAHRLVFELTRGPIRAGLQLDHLCRTRGCVNPAHQDPVTGQENMNRVEWPKAQASHCKHGHPFDEANTLIAFDRKGRRSRDCRACHRIAERLRQRRVRLAIA